MNFLSFSYIAKDLKVSFRIFPKVPAKATFSWDFGDFKETSSSIAPEHEYETEGFYEVTLTVTPDDSSLETVVINKTVIVSNHITTRLSDSIYNLFDLYLPSGIAENFSPELKTLYIQKWQAYVAPLVNHEIPVEEIYNELYYESLENQLVMELAILDYLNTTVNNMLLNTGNYLENITKVTQGTDDTGDTHDSEVDQDIKKITTGPTEVEYYERFSDSMSSLYKVYTQAIKPGGTIDELRNQVCSLAERLDIMLPFCTRKYRNVVVPRVGIPRKPSFLGGPDPIEPLK